MKIEKGKKYLIIDVWHPYFSEGLNYTSPKDDFLTDDDGDDYNVIGEEHKFQLVEEPTTEELLKRIEALETYILNAPFVYDYMKSKEAAKFKAIADHANAINDIIKNAPE